VAFVVGHERPSAPGLDMRRAGNGYRFSMLRLQLMARTHGAFNVAGGVWPLLHQRSFEAVFGPKVDRWLVQTVAGLLTSVGYAQVRAGTPQEWGQARRLGVGTALTLLAIDIVYVPRGRIRWTYAIDAVGEAALLVGWAVASRNQYAQAHTGVTAPGWAARSPRDRR